MKTVAKLMQQHRDEHVEKALVKLDAVEGLRSYVQGHAKTIVDNANKEAADSSKVSAIAEPTSKKRLYSETANQGRFGLCSQYALAVAVSHALQGRYRMNEEPQRLLDIWQNRRLGDAAWPDDAAKLIGVFALKQESAFYRVSIQTSTLNNFNEAASRIHRSGGYRHILVVADVGSGTHSMVGTHWNADGTVSCQNSWGVDIGCQPMIDVSLSAFHKAFVINVQIEAKFQPDASGKSSVMVTPVENPEWVRLMK